MSSSRRRRQRSNQACDTCRRRKTRCDLPDDDGGRTPVRCQRCVSCRLTCSFESSPPGNLGTSSEELTSSCNYEDSRPGFDLLGPPLATNGQLKECKCGGLWRFLPAEYQHGIDWSSPAQGIQDLLSRTNAPPNSFAPVGGLSLEDVLDHSMIIELNSIFEQYFDPWLNFQSAKDRPTPTLDLMRCSVASRLIHRPKRADLQRVAEDRILSIVLNPPSATIELIQSLLIFSLWAPIHDEVHGPIRDGRGVISVAITMAKSLRLHQLSAIVRDQRLAGDRELVDKARLWISLCNAESLMCLGAGHIPLSRLSAADRCIFENTYPLSPADGQDTRLHKQSQLFEIAERGWCIDFEIDSATASPTSTSESSDLWRENVTHILQNMSALHNSLPVNAEHERFQFDMLRLLSFICRLTFIYHAIFEAWHAYRNVDLPPGIAWMEQTCGSLRILPNLIQMSSKFMEEIVDSLLQAEPALLSTAPDALFRHIAFVGSMLVSMNRVHEELPFNDEFIGPIIEKCSSQTEDGVVVTCGGCEDYPAVKAGKLVELMWDLFQDWQQRQIQNSSERHLFIRDTSQPFSRFSSTAPPQQQMQHLEIHEPSMFVGQQHNQPVPTGEHGTMYPNQITFELFDQLITSAPRDTPIGYNGWNLYVDAPSGGTTPG